MLTITTIMSALGVRPYLNANGIDLGQLAAFCLIWGFGGAFISLGLSRIMAKWMMGVKVIDPNTSEPRLAWLVQTVHQQARAAGLPKMPEVGIYNSPEVNAFATGPTKSRALVAVSEGLLSGMNKEQVEGVLGHEVAHIANGDMVTMTLVQGLVNAFVMFFARIAAWALSQMVDEEKRPMVNFIAVIVFEIAFMFLGMFVVAYVSRVREFRADAGGAKLAGRDRMISALRGLQRNVEMIEDGHASLASLKISGRKPTGLMAMLSTHPPLEDRIRRLEMLRG
jgi:heat shock protein HtpX